MPKKIVQDIVPQDEGSRSIRNIPVTRSKKRVVEDDESDILDLDDERPIPPTPVRIERTIERPPRPPVATPKRKSSTPDRRSRYMLWSIVALAVIVLIFAFSGVFSGAKVTVIPKTQKSDISARILAKKDANDAELLFEVITLSKEGTREAEATGEQMVETKATGTITIYNNHSTAVQPLVARTRFEAPNGLIYRILSPVSVPGKKGTTPGSIDVKVTADQAGANYNIDIVDFTIPGFENDAARYKNITARSKTPMTGGMKGQVKVVKESDVAKMRELIRGELKLDLYNQAKELVGDDSVLYESAVFIDWTSLPNGETADNKVLIREKADLNAIVFKKDQLSQHTANVSMADADGVLVENVDSLQFSLIGVDPRPWEKETVQFNLKGEGRYVWKSDLEAFELALLGKTTKNLPEILSNFPGIDRTEVVIRPFWKKSFPADVSKITIVEGTVDE